VSVDVRTCESDAERAQSVLIFNAVWPRHAVSAEEVASWRRQASATTDLLAAIDGIDVGAALAAVDMRHPGLCFTLIAVLPELRRRGAGAALFATVTDWARNQEVDAIETLVDDDDHESLEFAARRGFEESSREAGLELDVQRADPSGSPPEGVQIVSVADRPELAEATWEVAAEAIPDIPGDEHWTPPPRERWADDFLLGPSTPPEAVFVAVAGDEVVGYGKLRLAPDGASAVHGMTAVRRAWRGRGVGTALKLGQIAWAKSQGIERLVTANEVRNAAMQHVNERLGYRPVPGRVHLRKSLSDGT